MENMETDYTQFTDYVYLADSTSDVGKKKAYAEKALEIDPTDIDAGRIIATCTAKNGYDLVCRLEKVVEDGRKKMEDEGYLNGNAVGRFYGILDTRPYMRAVHHLALAYIKCGMLRRAAKICEYGITLNKNDNLGLRDILMHIYCRLEDEEKASSVMDRYETCLDAPMLFPAAFLHFKRGDFEKSASYLREARKDNGTLKKFLSYYINGDITDEVVATYRKCESYTKGSISEYLCMIAFFNFAYNDSEEFFIWANRRIRK